MTEEVLSFLLHRSIPFSTIPRISLVYKMLDVYLVIISIKRMYGHNLTDETLC
jgi:hypothetical protein